MPTVKFIRAKNVVKEKVDAKVDTIIAYKDEIRRNKTDGKMLIVEFFAEYAEKACAPVQDQLRKIGEEHEGAVRVVRVDIDTNDDAVEEAAVRSVPSVHFWVGGEMRAALNGPKEVSAKMTETVTELLTSISGKARTRSVALAPPPVVTVLETIKGGGPQFIDAFIKHLDKLLTPEEAAKLQKFKSHSSAEGEALNTILANISTTDELATTLATMPLKPCEEFVTKLTRAELGVPLVNSRLAFDVSNHDAANTVPAKEVIKRFEGDVKDYADEANSIAVTKITKLSDQNIHDYFAGSADAERVLTEALAGVKMLMTRLQEIRDADVKMVQDAIPLIEKAANWVTRDVKDTDHVKSAKVRFLLNREAGQNAGVWVEFLFGTLISTKGEQDLLRLNPFIAPETVTAIFNLITTSMLRANRLGLVNRCIGTAIGLEQLLAKVLKVTPEARPASASTLIPKLVQVGEDLSASLTMARHYMTRQGDSSFLFDPRYLVFEFVSAFSCYSDFMIIENPRVVRCGTFN